MIVRLQHVGLAVENLQAACETYDRLFGLKAVDYRNDQGKGFQLDARILLPNTCWLHVVQNWNPESRVNRFLRSHGEGLEHIALESDDIEADVAHLRVETSDLSERDITQVEICQPVIVFVKALNQNVAGRVSAISPLADTLGGDVVYTTTIDLDTLPPGLRAGMSVEVQFGAAP